MNFNTFSIKSKAYFQLTKPRVIELLLVITIPAMILAENGVPNFWLIINTLIGGAASAGSAGAFNCYIDRDIDRKMKRTADRPLVSGVITDTEAWIFATVLGVFSIIWLYVFTTPLAAFLSVFAIVFYVVVYTMVLKRKTAQNIVWGGIAGCMPVLIGWAAVTNSLSVDAFIMFLIVFFWTPAHYWPLAMKYRDDYQKANVPMLSVVTGRQNVGLQVILYAWATVFSTFILFFTAELSYVYLVFSAIFGGWFIFESHAMFHRAVAGKKSKAMRVFHGSIGYLTLVFILIALDPVDYIFF